MWVTIQPHAKMQRRETSEGGDQGELLDYEQIQVIGYGDDVPRAGLERDMLDIHAGRVLFTRIGSIFAFSFTREKSIESLAVVKACDMSLFAKFHGEMLRRGVYLAPSGYEVGFLSTAHTDGDIEQTAAAVSESLDAVL